jgi:hypothetical protein
MRGDERVQDGMFSYVSLEQRVPQDHPLRAVRKLTDTVLRTLSAEFDALYAGSGRPSIAPEYILRALLLQVFYSVRSERLLVEQIDYNLLFRWFVGLGMDDAVLLLQRCGRSYIWVTSSGGPENDAYVAVATHRTSPGDRIRTLRWIFLEVNSALSCFSLRDFD